jgi:hypothetical protein
MTVAELIEELSRHDQDRIVYVGTKDAIAEAATVEDDTFEFEVGPAVLIECAEDE